MADKANKEMEFIKGTKYENSLKEYFSYRYIYGLIQLLCVSAFNNEKELYESTRQKLIDLQFKNNSLTRQILDDNFNFAVEHALVDVVPSNYFVAKVICKMVFR